MKLLKPILIAILLILLTVSAFFIRLDNFKSSTLRTIDEIVYARLSYQLTKKNPTYNSIEYGFELKETGRDLPAYFFKPLFKHPPLFSYLGSLSILIFGRSLESVVYISLLAGALLIPLTFWIGTRLFNVWTGLFAAILIWMDPTVIMCSQKVWMGTTIALFSTLTIACFIEGYKTNKSYWFILSAICAGLATLTKYTGLLPWIGIIAFLLITSNKLTKQKNFFLWSILPLIVFSPWIVLNLLVYKTEFLNHLMIHADSVLLKNPFVGASVLGIISLFGFLLFKFMSSQKNQESLQKSADTENAISPSKTPFARKLIYCILLIAFSSYILGALNPFHIPYTTWAGGVLSNAKWWFYLGRLTEYSLLMLFAYWGIVQTTPRDTLHKLLRWTTVLILGFFILWGNFQTRYVIQAIPFLYILASHVWLTSFENAANNNSLLKRIVPQAGLLLFLTYALYRTHTINTLLSFTNDMCYF